MRYRATLAYDGGAYLGFQRQKDGIPTIQSSVEKAISSVTQSEVTIVAAGRTDTGVHAQGQVIAFDVDWKHDDAVLLRAINANLPDDIALQSISQQANFHPRYDALSRRYIYHLYQSEYRQPLLEKYAWHITFELDLLDMQQAASLLIGEHDFAAFGQPPQGTNTVRHIFVSEWTQNNDENIRRYSYTIEATAFLYHMVRRIVGNLVEVGRGRLSVRDFEQILQDADLAKAKNLAPPHGLVLDSVRYNK